MFHVLDFHLLLHSNLVYRHCYPFTFILQHPDCCKIKHNSASFKFVVLKVVLSAYGALQKWKSELHNIKLKPLSVLLKFYKTDFKKFQSWRKVKRCFRYFYAYFQPDTSRDWNYHTSSSISHGAILHILILWFGIACNCRPHCYF